LLMRQWHVRNAIISFLILALAVPIAYSTELLTAIHLGSVSPQGLSRDQAEQLLRFVLKHQRYKIQSPDYIIAILDHRYPPPVRGYFDFAIEYAGPKDAAFDSVASFAVNLSTGDVWKTKLNPDFDRCKRYAFPALRRIQEKIMKQTGKTFADEKEQRKGLSCTDE